MTEPCAERTEAPAERGRLRREISFAWPSAARRRGSAREVEASCKIERLVVAALAGCAGASATAAVGNRAATPAAAVRCYAGLRVGHGDPGTKLRVRRTVDPGSATVTEEWFEGDPAEPSTLVMHVAGSRCTVEEDDRGVVGQCVLKGPAWAWTSWTMITGTMNPEVDTTVLRSMTVTPNGLHRETAVQAATDMVDDLATSADLLASDCQGFPR